MDIGTDCFIQSVEHRYYLFKITTKVLVDSIQTDAIFQLLNP